MAFLLGRKKALRLLDRAYACGMNLDYEPWKLYLLGLLFLAVLYGLAPYFADAERQKEQEKLKKQASVKKPASGRLG